jgi:hypothetical protein
MNGSNLNIEGLVELTPAEAEKTNGGSWLAVGLGAAFGLAASCALSPIGGWAAGTALAIELEAFGV